MTRAPIAVAAWPRTLVGDGAPALGGQRRWALPDAGTGSQEWNVSQCPKMSQVEFPGHTVHACAGDEEEWREDDSVGHERTERCLGCACPELAEGLGMTNRATPGLRGSSLRRNGGALTRRAASGFPPSRE